jgi:hypothetical protein
VKKKKNKKITTKVPLPATLDRINQMLKFRFSVNHINYVTDNGIIQNGWLISNEESIDEAILILQKQNAPVYILGNFASAIIGWNTMRTKLIGSLWRNEKPINQIETDNFEIVKQTFLDWYQIANRGEEK